MFVVGVAAGKVEKCGSSSFSGTTPSPGHHSLVADSNTPGINYDELVIYQDGAMVPKYLILFK